MNTRKNLLALAATSALAGSMLLSASASAAQMMDSAGFGNNHSNSAATVLGDRPYDKEGKCGGDKGKEGKCGEGKCGSDKGKEGKCGEGKCGGDKGKEGKCGGKK